MIETISALRLKPPQVAQLIGYCVAYRSYLWQSIMPTPERNQVLRGIQTLQGRLEKVREQGQAERALPLVGEEKSALRHLLNDFTRLYGKAQQFSEITKLRAVIEQMQH